MIFQMAAIRILSISMLKTNKQTKTENKTQEHEKHMALFYS